MEIHLNAILISIILGFPDIRAYLLDPAASTYVDKFVKRFTFKDGDLLIGGLFSIHAYSETEICGSEVFEPAVYHATSMMYAIDAINNDPTILPNITLGYAIFDECRSDATAMLRMLHLFPDKPLSYQYAGVYNNATFPTFDVVGVVGPATSSSASMVARMLGSITMPVISFYATADSLSDNSEYPYFLRTIPPDVYQVRTLVKLIEYFKWTYIAAVFQGAHGEGAIGKIQQLLSPSGICFATKEAISKTTTDSEYDGIIARLRASGARVVLVYASAVEGKKFFNSFGRLEAYKDIIAITSDGLGGPTTRNPESANDLPNGMMVTEPFMTTMPDFDSYFGNITMADAEKNFIFRDFWEHKFGCSFENGTCHALYPSTQTFTKQYGFVSDASVSLVTDAVTAFAHAIENITSEMCPGTTGKALRSCFFGRDLLEPLKAVEFQGQNHHRVSFDANGDILGNYTVMVIHNISGVHRVKPLAILDISNDTFKVYEENINWHPAFQYFDNSTGYPKSVCSEPCLPGYFKYSVGPCCWRCVKCRNNEKTDGRQVECIVCPDKQWPTADFLSCEPIQETFAEWRSASSVALAILASAGLLLCFLSTVVFVKCRDNKLIKASSVELMYVIITGMTMSLVTVFFFLAMPTYFTCITSYQGFILSFTLTYAPLLTKTRRIYAIFDAGTKTTKEPPFISRVSQLVITAILVFAQVIIGVVTAVLSYIGPKSEMPDMMERYVELGCELPQTGLLCAMGYNVLLVIISTYFAFKVRKVPDNFNESKFIAFNVYTTMVVFIVFIPTYLTTGSLIQKVLFLILCLIINMYVVFGFLFLPKLYAVGFLDVKNLKLSNQVSSDTEAKQKQASSGLAIASVSQRTP